MALPEGVTTATVIAGVPVTHTGAAVKAFVSIEPSAYLVHAATGTPLVDFLEEVDLSEGVAGQFILPHTDQPGFIDASGNAYTNWYYTARVTYSTPSKSKTKPPKVKVFQLTTGQTTVDLDLLPAGAPALPYIAPTATVTAFQGRTGPVTLEESDLPARLTDTALNATFAPGYTVNAGSASGTKVQAAITALGANGGEIILNAGTHVWDVIPLLPHSLTGTLTIRAVKGAVIQLTAAAPRTFDLARTADHQTFRNIRLLDLDVDAANLGGRHHVLVGNYANALFSYKYNLDNWRIERVTLRNVLTDPNTGTNHRVGIYLTPMHATPNEATQNTLTNIHVSDYKQYGGNGGMTIGAVGGGGPGVNVWLDNVTIERSIVDGMTTPATFYASTGFHLGQSAFGGRLTVRDCRTSNTGDNGIEINAWEDALVENCSSTDALNVGFYARNFHAANPDKQRVTWRNCRSEIKNLDVTPDKQGRGFIAYDEVNPQGFGAIVLDNCEVVITKPGQFVSAGLGFRLSQVPARSIHFNNFRIRITGTTVDYGSTATVVLVDLRPVGKCVTTGRITAEVLGTKVGANTTSLRVVSLDGTDHNVDLDVDTNVAMTGLTTAFLANIGEYDGVNTNIGGRIRANIRALGDQPRPFRFRAGVNITKTFFISGNLAGMAIDRPSPVEVDDAANKSKIDMSGIVWRTAPTPSQKVPSASPFTYTNVSMYPETVTVAPGGAGGSTIDSVSIAYAGGTAYDTGAKGGQFTIQNGDSITVAYTGGAAIIRATPAMPKRA